MARKNKIKIKDPRRFHQIMFIVCLTATLLLFAGGALTPPMFIVDASLLYCAGFLLGFATISEIPYLVELGKGAKVKIGDKVEIDVGNNDDDDDDNYKHHHPKNDYEPPMNDYPPD